MEPQDRYSRHFRLPGFTNKTQSDLLSGKVVVVGAGGLGIPVLQYLTGAGVGEITIIDDDLVSLSNLHRQIIYAEKDIDRPKAEVAKEILNRLNNDVKIIPKVVRLTQKSLKTLIPENPDVIVDASDNFDTRYLIDDFCSDRKIPLVYGALHRFEGQMAVFHHHNEISYRDLYPVAPEEGTVDNCEVNGVLGPVAGTIGCMMAIESIKILSGLGKVLDGEVLVLQFDDFSLIKIKIKKGSNLLNNDMKVDIPEITTNELLKSLNSGIEYVLVDIRDPIEFENLNIKNSVNIPTKELLSKAKDFSADIPIILICEVGKSSLDQIRMLKRNKIQANLINLKGGINEWYNKESP